jgi:hypothetical protein
MKNRARSLLAPSSEGAPHFSPKEMEKGQRAGPRRRLGPEHVACLLISTES